MTEARNAILGRIAMALAVPLDAPEVPRKYRRVAGAADLVSLFAELGADYRATVRLVPAAEAPAAINEALTRHRVRTVAVPAGLPRPWLGLTDAQILVDDPPLSNSTLDGVDAVVTGCAVAIAETGTIVLDGGPDQGRRVLSLLPDVHICVVSTAQVVGTVAEALERLEPDRPLTWISGPSATSDIELRRVEGVHGPRHLEVVLVAP